MDFQPKYVYCDRCHTGYAPRMVGSLCPQCGIPFSSVTGTVEAGTKDCGVVLHIPIPGELKEAFVTFLEVGLTSVTAYLEELEEDELQLVELLQSTIEALERTEPTGEETLSHNRTLLRGDSADIEGL